MKNLDQYLTREPYDDEMVDYPTFTDPATGEAMFQYDPSKPVDIDKIIADLENHAKHWQNVAEHYAELGCPFTEGIAKGRVDCARFYQWAIRYQQRLDN